MLISYSDKYNAFILSYIYGVLETNIMHLYFFIFKGLEVKILHFYLVIFRELQTNIILLSFHIQVDKDKFNTSNFPYSGVLDKCYASIKCMGLEKTNLTRYPDNRSPDN